MPDQIPDYHVHNGWLDFKLHGVALLLIIKPNCVLFVAQKSTLLFGQHRLIFLLDCGMLLLDIPLLLKRKFKTGWRCFLAPMTALALTFCLDHHVVFALRQNLAIVFFAREDTKLAFNRRHNTGDMISLDNFERELITMFSLE